MESLAAQLVSGTDRVMMLSKALRTGVTDKACATQPSANGAVVNTNHPAWAFGHLAIYPSWILETLGQPDPAVTPEPAFKELFKNGADCENDPERTIYPSWDAITDLFDRGHSALIEAIGRASDGALAKELPDENMRSAFGTVGGVAGFMLHDHAMFHLGQVSAWRRMMGLGPAM